MRILLCLLLLNLVGCGQKGPLFFPVDPPAGEIVEATDAVPSDDDEEKKDDGPLPEQSAPEPNP